MKGRMFDVVDFIARRYGAAREALEDLGSLRDALFDAGYQEEEVERGLAWLRRLQDAKVPATKGPRPGPGATRVATSDEARKLTASARSYLLRLERAGVLDAGLREAAYERAFRLDVPEVGLREIRVLVALLLEAAGRPTGGLAGGLSRAGLRKHYH